MIESTPHSILYLNGLGRAEDGNQARSLARYLESPNTAVTDASIDWYSAVFPELFDQTTAEAEQIIGQTGQLAIVGASAGVGLAVNVFERLRIGQPNLNLSLICVSGRVIVADLLELKENAPDFAGKKLSLAYLDSVKRCEESAVPNLTALDKQLIRTVRPLADQKVPLETMEIEGVKDYVVTVKGHLRGIIHGLLIVPGILDEMRMPVNV